MGREEALEFTLVLVMMGALGSAALTQGTSVLTMDCELIFEQSGSLALIPQDSGKRQKSPKLMPTHEVSFSW